LYFVAGPSLEHNTGQGLFGRIIAAGRPGELGSVRAPSSPGAESAANVAGPMSETHGAGAAQIPLLLIQSLSQNASPPIANVAAHASGLQSAASGLSTSIAGEQAAPPSALADKPIQTMNKTQTVTDALDGLFVALANDQADRPGELRL